MGDCLHTVDSLSKITEVGHIFFFGGGVTYFDYKSCVLIFIKTWVGLYFGRFFTSSSGHP
jgi:hypothetical protein